MKKTIALAVLSLTFVFGAVPLNLSHAQAQEVEGDDSNSRGRKKRRKRIRRKKKRKRVVKRRRAGNKKRRPKKRIKRRPGKSVKRQSVRYVNIYMPGDLQKTRVPYVVIDGIAVTDGDIELGPVKTLEKRYGKLRVPEKVAKALKKKGARGGSVVANVRYLWPNATIPYTVKYLRGKGEKSRKAIEKVRWAAKHLSSKTALTIKELTDKQLKKTKDYVKFVWDKNRCATSLGRQKGPQILRCNYSNDSSFPRGTIVHELLHVAGFNHTQKRHDRNQHIKLNWKKGIKNQKAHSGRTAKQNSAICAHQFKKASTSYWTCLSSDDAAYDVGKYDVRSIMHYSSTQCKGKDGTYSFVDKKSGKSVARNRTALTKSDIKMINLVYGKMPSMSWASAVSNCWSSRYKGTTKGRVKYSDSGSGAKSGSGTGKTKKRKPKKKRENRQRRPARKTHDKTASNNRTLRRDCPLTVKRYCKKAKNVLRCVVSARKRIKRRSPSRPFGDSTRCRRTIDRLD